MRAGCPKLDSVKYSKFASNVWLDSLLQTYRLFYLGTVFVGIVFRKHLASLENFGFFCWMKKGFVGKNTYTLYSKKGINSSSIITDMQVSYYK